MGGVAVLRTNVGVTKMRVAVGNAGDGSAGEAETELHPIRRIAAKNNVRSSLIAFSDTINAKCLCSVPCVANANSLFVIPISDSRIEGVIEKSRRIIMASNHVWQTISKSHSFLFTTANFLY
jgi:hypothetical protein